ncbi:TBC1 domain family member 15/17 isoform X1 [Haemaphysalis longicornis]
MADGGGERQLTYTQDNVSVRLLGPQGEDTVAGKLEITKERHGHVVSWAAYPPAASKEGEQQQQQRYDLDATGIWEDLSADSAVAYHVGSRRSKDRCEPTADTLQIRRGEEAESNCSGGDPPPLPAHSLSFEVTELASYRCRQVGDKHELTLNLHDGTRLPTLVFLERRHDHFVRALHEHVTFKRSDPDDANALVCVSALRATSPATEDVTGPPADDGLASPASSTSPSQVMSRDTESSVSKTATADRSVDPSARQAAPPLPSNCGPGADCASVVAPPSPAAFAPGVHTLRFFLPRAPNVTVVPGTAGGPAKLVPGPQAVRLLLSQAASQPQPVAAHPVQLLVQPPPPVESFPSGLVISDVRSQAGACSPPPPSAPAVAALRRRGPHWPPEEKLELLSLLRQRRHLVNPRLAEGVSKKEKLDGWKEVTDTLNRHHSPIGGGGRRCVAEVKKQWQNLFLKAKRERREMLSDTAAGKGVESTSLQLSVLSLKVFETFGDSYGAPEDECALPEDVDASHSILGPSSCLEPDGPFLSESHHPEVILLPRSPDVPEQQAPPPQDSRMTNGEGSSHHPSGHGSRRRRASSDCSAGPWGIKREKREAPDEGTSGGGSEEENGPPFNHWAEGPALNGHSLLGPLAKTCEVVQQAAAEVLSLRRREHKMKMAALRAKVDYYELKKRKLLLQQAAAR